LVKKAGDHVEAGETIAEIEEAKITNVISSPVAGYVLQILVEEGVSVPVLTTLCLIGTQEELQVQTEQPINVTLPNTSPTVSQPTSLEANKERLGATVEVTPVARKLAKELNVDLTSITGSGPGGRITEADVRQTIEKSSGNSANRDSHEWHARSCCQENGNQFTGFSSTHAYDAG